MDALKMEQPEAVSRHVEQPEAVSQHMEEAKEHLEPEQELFLSRMAELETMTSSSTCSGSQLSSDLSSRRFNFGLLAPVEVSKRIPEKSTKQTSRGKDKGYSGVLIPKDKNNLRAKKPNRKAHHDEDSENISDNSPLSYRKKDKNVSNVKNNCPADISSSVPESSAKSSDSKSSKLTSDSKEFKPVSSASITPSTRSQDSTPSTIELCSTSSNIRQNSPSLAKIAAQSNNQNNNTSKLNLPQSDPNSAKGSSSPSFSILEIGSLGKCTNEKATSSSSSTSLTSSANKSSIFSIPSSIGSSGAGLNSTKSSLQSMEGQNVSSSNSSGPDVKLGSLAGNSGSEKLSIPKLGSLGGDSNTNNEKFTIPKLGSLGGNSNTEKFTIPKLGSLGGTNTNTEKFTIPKLGSLGGSSNPDKFSIPQLGSLGGNSNSEKFSIPQIGSLGGNSNSEKFSIPQIGSLGGASNTNTEKFSIPKLGSLGGSTNSEKFSIPQLGSLGSGTPPSTSFTVPNLQGLATDSSKPATSLSSLSCLANLHLSSHSVPEQLANLSLENSVEDERSMKGDESSRSEDLSSMILENTDADDDTQDELSLQDDIDLTSALKAAKEAVKVSPEKVEEKKEVVTHLLIADLKKIKSKLINRKPSSLGRVISLRWRWKTPREKVTLPSLFSESADRFMFTDPSPDDIVLKAQTQSKSFLSRVKSESPSSGR